MNIEVKIMKNLNIHILYLKAERPNRYKFLTENVDKIKTTSTLEEVKKVFATDKIGSALKWHLTADYYFSRNQALETIFTYTQNYGKNQNEVLVRLKQYF